MPRPESYDDVDFDPIEIARIEVGNMGTDAELLTGYAAFLKAVAKAGAEANSSYNTVTITRLPSTKEKDTQLKTKQSTWDERKKHYETLRDVGSLEYSYQRNSAERHAEEEGLPWPPEAEPITSVDVTIANIDAVVSE